MAEYSHPTQQLSIMYWHFSFFLHCLRKNANLFITSFFDVLASWDCLNSISDHLTHNSMLLTNRLCLEYGFYKKSHLLMGGGFIFNSSLSKPEFYLRSRRMADEKRSVLDVHEHRRQSSNDEFREKTRFCKRSNLD